MNDAALKIVMIEDDADLCQGWADVFDLLGYQVSFFQRGRDLLAAPAVLETADLLITDYYLPDLNGTEIARRAREIRPEIPVILLTGSREPSVTAGLRDFPHSLLLFKPLGISELEAGIQQVIAKSAR